MSKKMMLLALSVVSAALFALPAVASATPAHLNELAGSTFTVSVANPASPTATLETESGEKIQCHQGLTGTGSFENTTTGTINLEFDGCTAFGGLATCTSHLAEGGTPVAGQIRTTSLSVHLIMPDPDENKTAGVLITPNAATGAFAHFTCAGAVRTVTGNGIIGTITDPVCGHATAQTTATLSFAEDPAKTGTQLDRFWTGTEYHLLSGTQKAAETAEGRIHFQTAKKIICT